MLFSAQVYNMHWNCYSESNKSEFYLIITKHNTLETISWLRFLLYRRSNVCKTLRTVVIWLPRLYIILYTRIYVRAHTDDINQAKGSCERGGSRY